MPSEEFHTWTDYTKYALSVEDRFDNNFTDPFTQSLKEGAIASKFFDRKRAMGVDFGPSFTGLALSMGGRQTLPLGTVRTGHDWKATAVKIAQIASTRRVRDIVIGLPLNKGGGEDTICRLVRHFSQILADASLLLLGGNVTVYLWDERFSTAYGAMRLITRPRLDSGAFKSWLDGQRGLNFNAKALLDSEASRVILEHWLDKDPTTEVLNKERSERVPPSKEAAKAYLLWKRINRLPAAVPEEPAGPGAEGWEWAYRHPEGQEVSQEEYMRRREEFIKYMQALDHFGDREFELEVRAQRKKEEKEIDQRIKASRDERPLKEAFEAAMSNNPSRYGGYGQGAAEQWLDPR